MVNNTAGDQPERPGQGSTRALLGSEGHAVDHARGLHSRESVFGFRGLVWSVSTFLFVAWCIIALGFGVNYSHTFWDWLPVLAFGLGVPAGILWQANRVLVAGHEIPARPSARDKENELLDALSERRELTAITAAMRTSLTADEAAELLDGLAGKGYLRLRLDDGVQAYSLPEPARREMLRSSDGPPAGAASEDGGYRLPQGQDLSERELEVLALLASGRTNSEIAGDLFVAGGTVKAHVANIYRKLEAGNRAEAISRARELRLLP